jgi:type VI protein secretion system component VasF
MEKEQNTQQLADLMLRCLCVVFEGKEEEKQEIFGMATKPKEE